MINVDNCDERICCFDSLVHFSVRDRFAFLLPVSHALVIDPEAHDVLEKSDVVIITALVRVVEVSRCFGDDRLVKFNAEERPRAGA